MTLGKNFTANSTPAEGDFFPSWLAAEGSGSERKTTLAQLRTALFGTSSYAVGDLLQASSTTALAKLAAVATGNVLLSGGVTTASAWGKAGLTTHVSGVLPEANGGTNQSTYTQGDLLYASADNTLGKLAKNTSATRYLSNTGSSNAPAWSQVNLANGVTGTLPATSGGSGIATYTQGDILYSDATNSLAKLAKNTTATRSLTNTGTNNAPAWAQVDLMTGVTGVLPAVNGGGPVGVSLDSDMAAYSTVALQDMTNMSFAVTTGHHYSGRFTVSFRVAGTGTGAVFSVTSGTGTYTVMIRIQNAANGTAGAFLEAASSGTGTAQTCTFPTMFAGSTQIAAIIDFSYSCTATGTLKLQYSPAAATALTVKAGTIGYIQDNG